jgi:2-oxo-3-hexenedioate decarboxylase
VPEPETTARALLTALDEGRQIAPLTDADPGFDLAAAYRVAAEVTRLREARGERRVGRKLGFTNRTIWDEYGVHAPIWGPVYDSTTAPFGPAIPLGHLVEPRIEPEIVLRLGRAPRAGMNAAELMACVTGVALGFELVQSLYPGWRFRAPDTVAAFALHGALRHGPFAEVSPDAAPAWAGRLAGFDVTLSRNGVAADRGNSANVLGGGPLAALSHLLDVLDADPTAPPLRAGEIVTTGTLTRALPVAQGERWRAEAQGLGLPPAQIALA